MEERRLAKLSGPPIVAALAAVMIPTLSPWIGFPLLAAALALTAYGHWWELVESIPFLRQFKREPMPFRDVVRRVALHTEWALSYVPREQSWPTWQDDLKRAVREPLAAGKVQSRGRRDIPGEAEATARTDISPEFWAYSDFMIEYHLVSNDASMAFRTGDPPVEVITDIVMDRGDVDRIWPVVPSRKRRGRKSPFADFAREWHDEQQQAFLNGQLGGIEFDATWEELRRRRK